MKLLTNPKLVSAGVSSVPVELNTSTSDVEKATSETQTPVQTKQSGMDYNTYVSLYGPIYAFP